MKLKILVIDDEATSSGKTDREPTYKSLESPDRTHVSFARSSDEAQDKLRRETYDVVLLDVWLKDPPFSDDEKGTVFQGLFLAASEVSMVALISSNWDNTVVPRVSRLLAEHPEVPVPPMLSFEELRKSHFAAVTMQLRAELRRRRSGLDLGLEPDDPLYVAHISDLHFGSTHESETLAGEANLDALANAITRTTNGPPHILAITGDVSNTGHPSEYEKARVWLTRLCELLKVPLPSRRVLLVPGNHDFSLPLALSMTLQGVSGPGGSLVFESRKPTDKTRMLAGYATQGFHDLAARVTGSQPPSGSLFDGYWLEEAFREYGVIFSGLNSCGRVKDDAWPDRWVELNLSIRIARRIRVLRDPTLFHVMLSHHSPLQTECREPITNTGEFATQFMSDEVVMPNVILHGHEHSRRAAMPSGDRILVVCAPTPSVRESGRPPDSLRGLNLLTLRRKGGHVESAEASSLVFEGGRWMTRDLGPLATVKRRKAQRAAGRPPADSPMPAGRARATTGRSSRARK